ncbi:MAG: DUF3014 domain-containing protein [Candidatus Aminicenantes bacterium]|nr:DUF3014 domain-containing protein [Candidatus Aminicenantes bacterium]
MDEKQKIIRAGIVILIVIVLGISAYYYFFSSRNKTVEGGVPPLQADRKESSLPEVKEISASTPLAAPLDASDESVRSLIGEISRNPVLARWLRSKDLLRRFAAAVDNISLGQSPRNQFDFFVPAGPFKTIQRSGRSYLDPASYSRYDVIADVFDSLSSEGCARAYGMCRELLQQAYRELGYPSGDFHQTLDRAIVVILRTPVVEEAIAVEKDISTYIFTDSGLEGLNDVQKHLIRMGPENLQLIQVKLREIALALGFTDTQLPLPRPYRKRPRP